MSSPAVPQPPRSGPPTGRLVAIVIGAVFGIVFLTIGALAVTAYLVATKVHVTSVEDPQGRPKSVRIETPFGRLRVDTQEKLDPVKLGIPIYPGAVVVQGEHHGASVDVDIDFANESLRVVAAELETPDPFDKVVEFYHDEAVDFVFSKKSSGKVEFVWQQGKLKKVAAIRERGGKTRISLASIGEPEAN